MNAPEKIIASVELRDIPGFEGRYAAAADGRIWSAPKAWASHPTYLANRTHGGQFLKPEIGRFGYHRVMLYTGGKGKRYLVHRLVALAWIPNPENLPFVNHKDGDKAHNAEPNLEWCTRGENERHAWRTGLKKDTPERRAQRRQVALAVTAKTRKLTRAQADDVRIRRAAGTTWSQLSRDFKLGRNAIKAIVNGQTYTD